MSASYSAPQETQCNGKHTYIRSSDAKRAAKHAMTKYGGSKLTTYHCEWCGRWHNGHTPKWRHGQ